MACHLCVGGCEIRRPPQKDTGDGHQKFHMPRLTRAPFDVKPASHRESHRSWLSAEGEAFPYVRHDRGPRQKGSMLLCHEACQMNILDYGLVACAPTHNQIPYRSTLTYKSERIKDTEPGRTPNSWIAWSGLLVGTFRPHGPYWWYDVKNSRRSGLEIFFVALSVRSWRVPFDLGCMLSIYSRHPTATKVSGLGQVDMRLRPKDIGRILG
ncbi:hypothetical protein CIHG_03813 [Coccidioides immitis H538.4]|uniref:Uncharacterized protein n=3 Tax=Coccidioides immitis TaxID=5501 RepID=A0A0J8QY67_COCIT|nr:hypothetical protein CIRG_04993 [Coccidioides immitis RMSCC 2394]KMU77839.1 hypothetical protein CISG_01595 [Coccidioides immitis RMSCC 3703]KMU85773.1 hypothetical protein CIHG_03813 [Coccidioides immitis H538.4]